MWKPSRKSAWMPVDPDDDVVLSKLTEPSKVCDLCDDAGHTWKQCPRKSVIMDVGEYYYGPKKPTVVCNFCKGPHRKEECQRIKQNICQACGLRGHFASVCNKIKLGPKGQVGYCTYKKCKGADKWGHFITTCPKRLEDQGPYLFKDGEDSRKALRLPRPMKRNK